MTTHTLRRQALVPLAGLLGLLVAFGTPALTATEQEGTKILYLSVTDQDGKSVTDLKTDEVLIRESDGDREVVSVKKSTQPLAIEVLADTTQQAGGSGMMSKETSQTGAAELIRDIRVSLGQFMKDIAAGSPESQMQLMEFGQAAIPITKMTSDVAELEKGITRLFPKPNAGSLLLEAIVEASKELSKAKAPRRAIVALNIEPGDEQSAAQVEKMHNELVKSRASLWAVSLQVTNSKNQMRGMVLDRLTANTGGRRESIQAQSALELMMKNIANNLLEQYEVTFKRPSGKTPAAIAVGIKRDGLKLYASKIPPQ